MLMKIKGAPRSVWRILPLVLPLWFTAPLGADDVVAPRLVLVVVVDQLGGDVPARFGERFGPDGFRAVLSRGTYYRNAHYEHANTVTAVGHATLATGGNPLQHGMVGNDWYDAVSGRSMNCVEDERSGEPGGAPAADGGRSPRNLTSSTFGDELVRASGGRSRVFAVSIKDRAAIILGGRLGKAYWYSRQRGEFVTSSYYHDAYPEWVRRWNAARPADRFADTQWTLLLDRDTYAAAGADDRAYERPDGTLGRTFPHPLSSGGVSALYSNLRSTPMGDELTLAFIEALMAAEEPGQHGYTDVLAVSFSVTDYIGHAFGPDSLEAEDNLLRLDRTLARLFHLVDREVGLDRTLVVLVSDHGIAPIPESMVERGVAAGRLDAPAFTRRIDAALKTRFATRERLAPVFSKPDFYLDTAAIKRLGLELEQVEQAVAEELVQIPGVAFALTRSDLLKGRIPDVREAEGVFTGFHPRRSGNVTVVAAPFWYLDATPYGNAAMHGSPYRYDTHVPIAFAGPGVPRRVVDRPVTPRDVAPTISAYLGAPRPSGSVGSPLSEVLAVEDAK